jgi:competence protein ComGC
MGKDGLRLAKKMKRPRLKTHANTMMMMMMLLVVVVMAMLMTTPSQVSTAHA